MEWSEFHSRLLASSLNTLLGQATDGAMGFVRCLSPEVVRRLATDKEFAPGQWVVRRVADSVQPETRTITADKAVELRENKRDATLLLVDTQLAGAGMDGIYSATHEVDESRLFKEAHRLAKREIRQKLSGADGRFAEQSIKKARGFGALYSVSLWAEFDFLCQVATNRKPAGAHLHLIGLWPILGNKESGLVESRNLVDNLLGPASTRLAPAERIDAVNLDYHSSHDQRSELERFLHSADTKPLLTALNSLAQMEHLWVGSIRTKGSAESVQAIELMPWRTSKGKILRWTGLFERNLEETPAFILDPNAEADGSSSTLEIRWKAKPNDLDKNAEEYRVSILTDKDEELAVQDVLHSARKGGEKCRFTNDDFSSLSEDVFFSAKVVVSVVGNDSVPSQESEEFVIHFGDPPKQVAASVATKVRTLSEGLIELEDRESASSIGSPLPVKEDAQGYVILRTPQSREKRKSFKVFRPPLIAEVEKQWLLHQGQIGRWIVKVRQSGRQSDPLQFEPIESEEGPRWSRAESASHNLAKHFGLGGSVGQVYDETLKSFKVVQEYLHAWTDLLEAGNPLCSLANTIEVKLQSGRTVGLIVLPTHPLRVAWLAAYDNLVLHSRFDQGQKAHSIRKEFAGLDGAMFPTFLPSPEAGTYVFADTLGFHAVGMVPEQDKEPKASIAILARALVEGDLADIAPSTGKQSATVLKEEIVNYLECHETSHLLHIHALRAGDGQTVASSLGSVHRHFHERTEEEELDTLQNRGPVFSLEIYPSSEQRAIAGQFIMQAAEKRRRGAGVLAEEDRWMLESIPLQGRVNMPKLRWARKEHQTPRSAAHLALAFDTFESSVIAENGAGIGKLEPIHVFGLLSFFDREYTGQPMPTWMSETSIGNVGEKHPSRRAHTERLTRLQRVIQGTVARHIGGNAERPTLKTEISIEKAENLKELHRLCDWVVTLDKNAGIEYFDSPREDGEIYDAYVIDSVPDREDLGCLQLITSTTKLDEVRNLIDHTLVQMGLSHSRRNAEFLMENLKELSGRLAIRLTGNRPANPDLIALAFAHANCQRSSHNDACWVSIEDGFLVPVDDVCELLLPLNESESNKQIQPNLIFVSVLPRKGLTFKFINIHYRRHLRSSRSPDLLKSIESHTRAGHEKWNNYYDNTDVCSSFQAIRRAKLARVLRFYADKAYRHNLPKKRHAVLISEIDRMIEKGGEYSFATVSNGDRGWVFCPEYAGQVPHPISPDGWNTKVYMFGPNLLPDLHSSREESSLEPPDILVPVNVGERESQVSDGTKRQEVNSKTVDGTESLKRVTGNAAPSVCLGMDSLSNNQVHWPLTVKGNPHLLVAGLPGMGKTTCLLNLCQQMVAAKIRPIVFSYHQDIDEKLQQTVPSVRFVDFDGLGFNPLQVLDRKHRKPHLDVAGAIRDIFNAIYPELGFNQCNRIRRAIKDSFDELGWGTANSDLSKLPEPEFKRFVEILNDDPRPDRGLRSLQARLEELDDYGFFDTGETRQSLWERDEPTVIRIHSTQNENLQRAFASLVFYGLYKDMFRRGIQERVTHALIFDEAHRAARLKLIPTMAKECRKYGISLVLASQEARDFDSSVFSAIANYLILRLTETDAKFLVKNVSTSRQERKLIDDIKQMERFKALYFREGSGRPFRVKLAP